MKKLQAWFHPFVMRPVGQEYGVITCTSLGSLTEYGRTHDNRPMVVSISLGRPNLYLAKAETLARAQAPVILDQNSDCDV